MIILKVIHSLNGENTSYIVPASKFEEDDAMGTLTNIFTGKNSLSNFIEKNFMMQLPSYYYSVRHSSVHLFLIHFLLRMVVKSLVSQVRDIVWSWNLHQGYPFKVIIIGGTIEWVTWLICYLQTRNLFSLSSVQKRKWRRQSTPFVKVKSDQSQRKTFA